MPDYTDNQVEEMVREAVEKTEKSFGGTFKRLKSENEDLKSNLDTVKSDYENAKTALDERVRELENSLSEKTKHITGLTIQSELQRQLREKGPVPERFVNVDSIEFSDDSETLKAHVSEALERAKKEFEYTLIDYGIDVTQRTQPNPTNPPRRDTKTAHDMKRAEAREVLIGMTRRGLLR